MIDPETEAADSRRAIPQGISAIVARARTEGATDVHLDPAEGIAFRVAGKIERRGAPSDIRAEDIAGFLNATFDRLSQTRLERIGAADAVRVDAVAGALRVHASLGKHGHRLAIRLLERTVPDLESLRLPAIVERLAESRAGLAILCGPSGSGKTTAAASLLDRANRARAQHLVTFEAPVEYAASWNKSVVTQYEVGRDVATYAHGLQGILRADPDVVFVGELREVETAAACLQVAEEAHLVIAVMTTPPEASVALNRFIAFFEGDEQPRARHRLADALRAVVALQLIRCRDQSGLRPVAEILVATEAVRRIIRDGATYQLRAVVAAERRSGMQTLEQHLTELVAGGEVDLARARACANYQDDVLPTPSRGVRG